MANFVAVLSHTLANVSGEEAEARLAKVNGLPGAESDSSFPLEIMGSSGSGMAWEKYTDFRRRSMDREAPKVSQYTRDDAVAVLCFSRLKRTMADNSVLQSMGFGQDNSDPNAPPPTDAHLVMGHLGKIFAKQRWNKAGNAIGALRALKGLGGAKAASPSGERQKRVSITALAGGTDQQAAVQKKTMGALPSDADLVEMLKKIKGTYSIVVVHDRDEYAFAARSGDGSVPLYWALGRDGSIIFSNSESAFPAGAAVQEFPKNAYYVGRCGEAACAKGVDSSETETELKLPSAPDTFCRTGAPSLGMDAPIAI